MADTFDVLIAGGSYAGLALAAALAVEARGDLKVGVVSPQLPPLDATAGVGDARASALSRGSLNLLHRLGVWEQIKAGAQEVCAIELTDSKLDDAIRPTMLKYGLESGATGAETSLPAMVIVENRRLGAALHEAARLSCGVTLIAGASVEGFHTDLGHARVTLSDGRALATRLLVAADGGRSKLRDAAGIGTIGWPYAQSGIVTIVEPEAPHGGVAVQHFLPGGPFALLPMTSNRVCVTWSEASEEAQRILALDAAGFRSEIETRFGSRLGTLKAIAAPQSWPLELSIARVMIGPRFALAGDAAHKVHPIAGQGLNLGLRDVAALAECVIDAARLGLDIGQADTLEHYERARRFDNVASAAGFDAINLAFSSESTLARSARGVALSVVDRLPGLKDWLVGEAAGDRGDVPRLMRGF